MAAGILFLHWPGRISGQLLPDEEYGLFVYGVGFVGTGGQFGNWFRIPLGSLFLPHDGRWHANMAIVVLAAHRKGV